MFGLRNVARSAPRSVARFCSNTTRPQRFLRQSAASQSKWAPAVPRLTASFHMSASRRQDGTTEELVAKLSSEIRVESNIKEDDDLSTNIKEYLENSPFEIEDKPGHHEVVLTRTYGDEKIKVTFTTADLNAPQEEDLVDDQAMYDDADMDTQSGGANTKGAINQGRTRDGNIRVAPEDRVAPADREELEDDYEDEGAQQGFPAHVTVRIERPGKGALAFEVVAQDGDFVISELYHFPTLDLADPQSAESQWSKRSLYIGPPFNNLDEDLQILLEKYLEERGINTRLALFIPDYIDMKEQKEYVRWLNVVKNFVE